MFKITDTFVILYVWYVKLKLVSVIFKCTVSCSVATLSLVRAALCVLYVCVCLLLVLGRLNSLLVLLCDSWFVSHHGYRTTKKLPPCQEFLLFVNIMQVGKADLCITGGVDQKGMTQRCDGTWLVWLTVSAVQVIGDWVKPISLVSAIAEIVAETRDTYTAVTES